MVREQLYLLLVPAIITHAAFRMKEESENETLSPVCLEGEGGTINKYVLHPGMES